MFESLATAFRILAKTPVIPIEDSDPRNTKTSASERMSGTSIELDTYTVDPTRVGIFLLRYWILLTPLLCASLNSARVCCRWGKLQADRRQNVRVWMWIIVSWDREYLECHGRCCQPVSRLLLVNLTLCLWIKDSYNALASFWTNER